LVSLADPVINAYYADKNRKNVFIQSFIKQFSLSSTLVTLGEFIALAGLGGVAARYSKGTPNNLQF
jgi:hypothetical protein